MDGRRVVVVGVSLKLYFEPRRTLAWCADIAALARRHPATRSGAASLFVLPTTPMISAVAEVLAGSGVAFGAQDLSWVDRGAYTGAVSGADLAELGCGYVEIAHAERRSVFHEGADVARLKLAAALRNGLRPVVCVGEREQGDAEDAAARCAADLDALFAGILDTGSPADVTIAYEPEWAIGAARPADPGHVARMIAGLRAWLDAHPGVRDGAVIYGGSAGPGLLSELGDSADGLFLGRFGHDPLAVERILDEVVAS